MKFFERYTVDRLDSLETRLVSNQEKINAIAAALQTATDGIRGDVQALKDAIAGGEPLDFTGLDAKVNALAGLDAENPTAPTS